MSLQFALGTIASLLTSTLVPVLNGAKAKCGFRWLFIWNRDCLCVVCEYPNNTAANFVMMRRFGRIITDDRHGIRLRVSSRAARCCRLRPRVYEC